MMRSMSRVRFVMLCAMLTPMLAWAGGPTPPPTSFTFDEDGHALVTTSRGEFTFNGALAGDPGPGGLASALTYDLSPFCAQAQVFIAPAGCMVPGDVVLLEPGTGAISDVLRFNGGALPGFAPVIGDSFVFYSDNADGIDALADTGFPTALYSNLLRLPETGPEEGPNGLFGYQPTLGQPGYIFGAIVTYNFISDAPRAVPEPATVALLGLGLAAFAARRGRRRN